MTHTSPGHRNYTIRRVPVEPSPSPSFFPQTAAHRRYKGALARLPMSILTGERTWPMAGETALRLATKLTE